MSTYLLVEIDRNDDPDRPHTDNNVIGTYSTIEEAREAFGAAYLLRYLSLSECKATYGEEQYEAWQQISRVVEDDGSVSEVVPWTAALIEHYQTFKAELFAPEFINDPTYELLIEKAREGE